MKRRHVFKLFLIDALCSGLVLVVFALFHHVLPRSQQSLNVATQRPAAAAQASAAPTAGIPDSADQAASDSAAATDAVSAATPTPAAEATASPRRSLSSGKTAPGQSRNRSMRGQGMAGSGEKGGSALTGDTAAQDETADLPLSQKFADQYTDAVNTSDSSYSSPNISVTVTEETTANGRITYYLADIYVRDVTCVQTVLAADAFGSGYRESVADMADRTGAVVAVNGDYYGNTTEGVVIRNGVIYRANPTDCDVCVLYYDGSMRVMAGSAFSAEDAVRDGAWQAWTFGPALLDGEGQAISDFNSTRRMTGANPRTAIGYYEPGHYCLVVVDGRGESAGISLSDLSELFYDLGCAAAYNLDGGNSSVMVMNGAVLNNPSGGGRDCSDALLIAEVEPNG